MRTVVRILAPLLCLLALAPAAWAAVPSGNLVQNPGGEAGQGANDASSQPATPSWSVTGTFTQVRYGAPGFPTAEDGSRAAGDKNFFAGGPGGAVSTASQTISVAEAATEIDAGGLGWSLSAFIGGYSTQGDDASVTASFLDPDNLLIGSQTIGPVSTADRKSVTALLPRTASGVLPPNTRSIQVVITAVRSEGNYNDGYIDNVDLTLGPPPPAPAFAKSVELTPVSGTVLVRLPGSARFVDLASTSTLPTGTIVDARKGRVRIEAVNAKGVASFADFYQGQFQLFQRARDKGVVLLTLFGGSFSLCGKGGIASGKKSKSIRHLWGQGSGQFRTMGRFASATIRGTTWFTDDECGGTLVRVTAGRVTVRDIPKKRTVVVAAPKRYFAAAR